MPFPRTRDELVAGGYKFESYARCSGCGADIEWWTTPRDRKMPLEYMQEGKDAARRHFPNICRATPPLFREAS